MYFLAYVSNLIIRKVIFIFKDMIENRSDDLKVMVTIQMRFYTLSFIQKVASAVEIVEFEDVF